jgi:basic amino acid/polyamine antiporter, APA family
MKAKSIGFWMATSLVMGNMIGSGVFLLPASLGEYGGISLGGWIVSGLGAMVLAMIFASLSRTLPKSGGPYAYARAAWGNYPGFLVAWAYWISICAANGAIAVAFVSYSSSFFPILEQNRTVSVIVGIATIWLLTFVNAQSVASGGRVQLVTSILKYVPILVLGIFGLWWFDGSHFEPLNRSSVNDFDAILQTGSLTLWAFLGLESATVPAGEVKNPGRIIPQATLVGTSLVFLVYILSFVAIQGILSPEELSGSYAPFTDATTRIWGSGLGKLMGLVAIIATFGALNGWILMGGQVPLAAAEEGFFPKIFSYKSSNGSPTGALVITAVIATLILLMNYTDSLVKQFTFLIQLSTLATLFPYFFCTFAEIRILAKVSPGRYRKRLAGRVVLGMLALAFVGWALIGLGEAILVPFLVLMASSALVYFLMRKPLTRPRLKN